jgi:hypothetical protein
MNANDLHYPVVCLTKYGAETRSTPTDLSTDFKAAFNGGLFDNLHIVDSAGKLYRVLRVKDLGGTGRCWGYSLFFSRRIKVELEVELVTDKAGVDEVRERVLKEFSDWHGWETRGDFDELKTGVEKAQTVAEIIRLLSS